MNKATIYDVAALARVSNATVSRALNESDKVKPETRERVLKAAKELGYKANAFAKGTAVNNKILAAEKIEEYLKQHGKEKLFNKAILQKKRGARDSLLFDLPTPDIKRWRETFPEINSFIVGFRDKKLVLYLSLFIHFDFLGLLLINMYKKVRNNL